MKNNKLEFQTPEDVEAVYYQAFQHCDVEVMAALWADGDVVCVHPGSGAIVGHRAVVRSWQHIFHNAVMPEVAVSVVSCAENGNLAVHVVRERINSDDGAAVVLATNVYQKFDSGWLMIEHHGSLVQLQSQGHTLQ